MSANNIEVQLKKLGMKNDVKLQSKRVNAIASRLALEVEKLTPAHLVQFCEYCIHCIQNEDGEQTSKVPLSTNQHLEVVNKLCASFEELPVEVPPLVHQLLQLCKDEHGTALFLRLQSCFGT